VHVVIKLFRRSRFTRAVLEFITMATAEHFLDRYLDPIADVLTPQAARRILDLESDAEITRYVEQLGEKSDAGTLTDAEREEYRALANAGTLVALLKAKARHALARHSN
jgi:hypothetical protein